MLSTFKIYHYLFTNIKGKNIEIFKLNFLHYDIINLEKLILGVGAIVGGGLDLFETKVIADRSYDWFMKENFS